MVDLKNVCLKTGSIVNMAAIAAVFLSAAPHAQAADRTPQPAKELSHREKYLTLKGAPKVTWVDEAPFESLNLIPNHPDDSGGGSIISPTEIGQIINIGKQIWDIIQANKPVVNVATDKASALPANASQWTDLQGWQAPFTRLYRYQYENLYSMSVVDFSYRVIFFYGGNVRGKGKYISNATIIPSNLSVAWGYTFNSKASVPVVLNSGSEEDPVAAMQMQVDWKIDTALKHEQSSQGYYIRGDGNFVDLGGGA